MEMVIIIVEIDINYCIQVLELNIMTMAHNLQNFGSFLRLEIDSVFGIGLEQIKINFKV